MKQLTILGRKLKFVKCLQDKSILNAELVCDVLNANRGEIESSSSPQRTFERVFDQNFRMILKGRTS